MKYDARVFRPQHVGVFPLRSGRRLVRLNIRPNRGPLERRWTVDRGSLTVTIARVCVRARACGAEKEELSDNYTRIRRHISSANG